MHEETKEEYIARHRKESGIITPLEAFEDLQQAVKKPTLKERLQIAVFLAGLVLFTWMVLAVFGMMTSN